MARWELEAYRRVTPSDAELEEGYKKLVPPITSYLTPDKNGDLVLIDVAEQESRQPAARLLSLLHYASSSIVAAWNSIRDTEHTTPHLW